MEKLKVYLDTNIIYGFFKSLGQFVIERKEYKESKKLIFLKDHIEELDIQTSFFTLLEVAKNLKEELKLKRDSIENLIQLFRLIFPGKILDKIILTQEIFKWYLADIQLRDAIQLNIAKNERAFLISDDKRLIQKASRIYQVITFKELRDKVK